jgi:hypothetical protein
MPKGTSLAMRRRRLRLRISPSLGPSIWSIKRVTGAGEDHGLIARAEGDVFQRHGNSSCAWPLNTPGPRSVWNGSTSTPSADGDPRSIARLGAYDVVAALYWSPRVGLAGPAAAFGPRRLPRPAHRVSTLPNHRGVAARLQGPTSKSARAAMGTAWSAARLALLGAPAPNRRKGETDPAHNPPDQGCSLGVLTSATGTGEAQAGRLRRRTGTNCRTTS